MKIIETSLEGCFLINLRKKEDERGYLTRLFCQKTFHELLKEKTICQINHTFTKIEGTIRGLHFQYPPSTEVKIISCLKGKIWDVVVDIRKGSPTFLSYYATELSQDDCNSLYVPEGFAHGFQTLTSDCEMLYFHTAEHNIQAQGAINPLDPIISIKWPRVISKISTRDSNHPMLEKKFCGIEIK